MHSLKTNSIETERLLLREINPEVIHHVFSKFNDDEIMQFLNLKSIEALDIEKEKYHKGFTMFNKSFCNFQLIEKSTQEIIGACGFHTWYILHARAEVGYAITDESKKQKGFMNEALKAIIHYGFETMQLNRIEAFATLENIASVKLLENNGFIYEGNLRQHYINNSNVEDSAVFGLIKSDYKK